MKKITLRFLALSTISIIVLSAPLLVLAQADGGDTSGLNTPDTSAQPATTVTTPAASASAAQSNTTGGASAATGGSSNTTGASSATAGGSSGTTGGNSNTAGGGSGTVGGTSVQSSSQVVTLTNPLNATYSSIPGIVGAFLNIVEYIGAICCALWIIWAGFSFVKARGNTDELTKAKSALLHAVIGTLIILAAGAIYTVIQSIINQIKA